MDYPSLFAVLLAVVGLALIVAEIFIPSGGMILIAAIVCFLGSVWSAWDAWSQTPVFFWSYIGVLLLLLPAAVIGAFYYFPRTEYGRRILLEAQSLEEVTPFAEEEAYLSGLIGSTGTTISLLNPGGMVNVNNERMHCESRGLLIEPNTEVEIIGVTGNRLVVRVPIKPRESEEKPDSSSEDVAGSVEESSIRPSEVELSKTESSEGDPPHKEEPPLDFDIPQS